MAGDKIPKIPNTTYQAEGREEKWNLYSPSFPKTLKTPNTYLSGNGQMSVSVVTVSLSAVTTSEPCPQVGTIKEREISCT